MVQTGKLARTVHKHRLQCEDAAMSLRSKFAVQTFKLHSAETFPARSPANRHIVVRDFIPKRFNGYSNTLVLTPKGLVKILITRSGGERGLPLAKHADSSRMLRRIKSLLHRWWQNQRHACEAGKVRSRPPSKTGLRPDTHPHPDL